MLTYTSFKLEQIATGSNMKVIESRELDIYDSQDSIDLGEKRMIGAFQITDFYSGKELNDENYVEWDAALVNSDGLPENQQATPLTVRICTPEDWS